MTTDILEQLASESRALSGTSSVLLKEAAKEIERLRKALANSAAALNTANNKVQLTDKVAYDLVEALECALGAKGLRFPLQYATALAGLKDAVAEKAELLRSIAAATTGYLKDLTNAQHDYMRTVESSHEEIAEYLRQGVEVFLAPNIEVPEAPPIALAVVGNPEFWIGCFSDEAEAIAIANKIGLAVIRHS